MLEQSTPFSLLASVVVGLCALGCVDPDGDYKEFQERDKKTTLPQGSGCGDPNAACDPVALGDLDGQWLFALSANLAPDKPILFFADIVMSDGGGLQWEWTITPLDAKTRTAITGAAGFPKTLPASPIPANGDWSVDLDPMDVPGAANPITGSDITADTALTGDVCGARDFLCGDVTGSTTKPLTLDLAGSTWTLQRLTAPDTLPEKIFVNCSCTEAGPPAT